MTQIILASSSPYRKALLKRLIPQFECISPDVDEDSFKIKISDPQALAQALAREKCNAVYEKYPNAIVIGSDQLGVCEGERLDKPGSLENAFVQLKFLSGKKHQLITAVFIAHGAKYLDFFNITTLKMIKLSGGQIKYYLSLDKPIDCAGSYKLELNGITLFEDIETTDYTAITGLPLIEVAKNLRELGINIPAKK